MSIRPPDEIISICATIKPPAYEAFEKKFTRVGHIYILQIGSGENCQIRNECLANLHASIEAQKLAAYITNYDRVRGTLVNGRRIHDRTTLRSGDEIRCGDMAIDITFEHPLLEGEAPKEKSKDELCPACREPWTRRPTECKSQPHWTAYVDHLERERTRLTKQVDELKERFGVE